MELSAPAELFHDDTMPVITAGIIFRKVVCFEPYQIVIPKDR